MYNVLKYCIERFINFKYTRIHMEILTKEDIIKINQEFDKGNIINENSLNFALSYAKDSKDWLKQLAFLTRAISLDHIFEEGNKRTVSALIITTLEDKKIAYDPYKIDKMIIKIIKVNITDITLIGRLIKDATR